jgi:hypothetical protein
MCPSQGTKNPSCLKVSETLRDRDQGGASAPPRKFPAVDNSALPLRGGIPTSSLLVLQPGVPLPDPAPANAPASRGAHGLGARAASSPVACLPLACLTAGLGFLRGLRSRGRCRGVAGDVAGDDVRWCPDPAADRDRLRVPQLPGTRLTAPSTLNTSRATTRPPMSRIATTAAPALIRMIRVVSDSSPASGAAASDILAVACGGGNCERSRE